MGKKSFRDLLVKLNNVYSSDLYIVNCLYIIAGKESDEDNKGYYLCKLTPEYMDVCKSELDSDKTYFISNIRDAKDDLESYIKPVTDSTELEEVNKYIEFINGYITDSQTWDNFMFTEISLKTIFADGLCEDFFENDDKKPTITLSKSMFPLVTAKTADKLYYNFFVQDDYADLVVAFDHDYFTLYMVYRCMDLSK